MTTQQNNSQYIVYQLKSRDTIILVNSKTRQDCQIVRIDTVTGALIYHNRWNYDRFHSLEEAQKSIFYGKLHNEAGIISSKIIANAIIGYSVLGTTAVLGLITNVKATMPLFAGHTVYTIQKVKWIQIQLSHKNHTLNSNINYSLPPAAHWWTTQFDSSLLNETNNSQNSSEKKRNSRNLTKSSKNRTTKSNQVQNLDRNLKNRSSEHSPIDQPISWDVAEQKMKKNIEHLINMPLVDFFFYCETLDLSHPFPSFRSVSSESDPEFIWNEWLSEPFKKIGLDFCCVKLLNGLAHSRRVVLSRNSSSWLDFAKEMISQFIQSELEKIDCDQTNFEQKRDALYKKLMAQFSKELNISSKDFRDQLAPTSTLYLCLISRRSNLFPGTRYNARGLNERGGVGNEMECEFFVWARNDPKTGYYVGLADLFCKTESELEQNVSEPNEKDLVYPENNMSIDGMHDLDNLDGSDELDNAVASAASAVSADADAGTSNPAETSVPSSPHSSPLATNNVTWISFVWRRGTVPVHWKSVLKSSTDTSPNIIVRSNLPHYETPMYFEKLTNRFSYGVGIDPSSSLAPHFNQTQMTEGLSHYFQKGKWPIHVDSSFSSGVKNPVGINPFEHKKYQKSMTKNHQKRDGLGSIVCLNLLRNNPGHDETGLTESFQTAIGHVLKLHPDYKIILRNLDWHGNMKYLGVDNLVDGIFMLIGFSLEAHGLSKGRIEFSPISHKSVEIETTQTTAKSHQEYNTTYDSLKVSKTHTFSNTWYSRQKGCIRINCADSLDRTNLCNFFICIQVLLEMCRRMGYGLMIGPPSSWKWESVSGLKADRQRQWPFFKSNLGQLKRSLSPALLTLLAELFIINGDICSLIYTSSPAMHSHMLREYGPKHTKNAPNNTRVVLQRRFHNVVGDQTYQQEIEIFLGMFRDIYFPLSTGSPGLNMFLHHPAMNLGSNASESVNPDQKTLSEQDFMEYYRFRQWNTAHAIRSPPHSRYHRQTNSDPVTNSVLNPCPFEQNLTAMGKATVIVPITSSAVAPTFEPNQDPDRLFTEFGITWMIHNPHHISAALANPENNSFTSKPNSPLTVIVALNSPCRVTRLSLLVRLGNNQWTDCCQVQMGTCLDRLEDVATLSIPYAKEATQLTWNLDQINDKYSPISATSSNILYSYDSDAGILGKNDSLIRFCGEQTPSSTRLLTRMQLRKQLALRRRKWYLANKGVTIPHSQDLQGTPLLHSSHLGMIPETVDDYLEPYTSALRPELFSVNQRNHTRFVSLTFRGSKINGLSIGRIQLFGKSQLDSVVVSNESDDLFSTDIEQFFQLNNPQKVLSFLEWSYSQKNEILEKVVPQTFREEKGIGGLTVKIGLDGEEEEEEEEESVETFVVLSTPETLDPLAPPPLDSDIPDANSISNVAETPSESPFGFEEEAVIVTGVTSVLTDVSNDVPTDGAPAPQTPQTPQTPKDSLTSNPLPPSSPDISSRKKPLPSFQNLVNQNNQLSTPFSSIFFKNTLAQYFKQPNQNIAVLETNYAIAVITLLEQRFNDFQNLTLTDLLKLESWRLRLGLTVAQRDAILINDLGLVPHLFDPNSMVFPQSTLYSISVQRKYLKESLVVYSNKATVKSILLKQKMKIKSNGFGTKFSDSPSFIANRGSFVISKRNLARLGKIDNKSVPHVQLYNPEFKNLNTQYWRPPALKILSETPSVMTILTTAGSSSDSSNSAYECANPKCVQPRRRTRIKRMFRCLRCQHRFCASCMNPSKMPILEFQWFEPRSVCTSCFYCISEQLELLSTIQTLRKNQSFWDCWISWYIWFQSFVNPKLHQKIFHFSKETPNIKSISLPVRNQLFDQEFNRVTLVASSFPVTHSYILSKKSNNSLENLSMCSSWPQSCLVTEVATDHKSPPASSILIPPHVPVLYPLIHPETLSVSHSSIVGPPSYLRQLVNDLERVDVESGESVESGVQINKKNISYFLSSNQKTFWFAPKDVFCATFYIVLSGQTQIEGLFFWVDELGYTQYDLPKFTFHTGRYVSDCNTPLISCVSSDSSPLDGFIQANDNIHPSETFLYSNGLKNETTKSNNSVDSPVDSPVDSHSPNIIVKPHSRWCALFANTPTNSQILRITVQIDTPSPLHCPRLHLGRIQAFGVGQKAKLPPTLTKNQFTKFKAFSSLSRSLYPHREDPVKLFNRQFISKPDRPRKGDSNQSEEKEDQLDDDSHQVKFLSHVARLAEDDILQLLNLPLDDLRHPVKIPQKLDEFQAPTGFSSSSSSSTQWQSPASDVTQAISLMGLAGEQNDIPSGLISNVFQDISPPMAQKSTFRDAIEKLSPSLEQLWYNSSGVYQLRFDPTFVSGFAIQIMYDSFKNPLSQVSSLQVALGHYALKNRVVQYQHVFPVFHIPQAEESKILFFQFVPSDSVDQGLIAESQDPRLAAANTNQIYHRRTTRGDEFYANIALFSFLDNHSGQGSISFGKIWLF